MSKWTADTIGNYIDVQNGYAFKSNDFKYSGGIPVIKIKNVASGKLDLSDVQYYNGSIEDKQNFIINKGNILIAMTGSHVHQPSSMVGRVVRYDLEHTALLNQRVGKIYSLDKNILDEDFIYHFYRQLDITYELALNAGGSANQANISPTLIKSLPFLKPTLPEQKAIAGVLSSLDEKIDLLHRQNKTLEVMAEMLFRQWFVKEARDDWEECKLGDILDDIQSGGRPKGGIDSELKEGIPSIGAENINGLGFYDFSKTKHVNTEFFNKSKKGIVKNYDVLIYKDGAYIGRKSMFANGFPYKKCMINEHVFILRTNSKANQLFLYFLLDQEELQSLNANSAQPGLNQASIKSLDIVLPPKNRIDEFEKVSKIWIDKIYTNSNQIRMLEKLRDTLLPKLMSGEVRVNLSNKGE